jgi:hypothetical protein
MYKSFGWPAVLAIAACWHLWELVFRPHRWGGHVLGALVWGIAATFSVRHAALPWPLAITLALAPGIQSAVLVLWTASELLHKWRRWREQETVPRA